MHAQIATIVYACPGNTPESYARGGRAIASFYTELLGMTLLRDDWFVIVRGDDVLPRLAFGDGPIDYRAPRWPDPEYPQQLHIDIPVADLEAAHERAVGLGAVHLHDGADQRTYADPIGHPFCLFESTVESESQSPIGRVVVDCFSPRALAGFYAELLDLRQVVLDTPERVVIAAADGHLPAMAFQHARFAAPRWPDPEYPQQVHLDIRVDDSAAAQETAARLGAIRLPALGGSCPVFADPAGHPFCLCGPGD